MVYLIKQAEVFLVGCSAGNVVNVNAKMQLPFPTWHSYNWKEKKSIVLQNIRVKQTLIQTQILNQPSMKSLVHTKFPEKIEKEEGEECQHKSKQE